MVSRVEGLEYKQSGKTGRNGLSGATKAVHAPSEMWSRCSPGQIKIGHERHFIVSLQSRR
jgi:hypothetical protein